MLFKKNPNTWKMSSSGLFPPGIWKVPNTWSKSDYNVCLRPWQEAWPQASHNEAIPMRRKEAVHGGPFIILPHAGEAGSSSMKNLF